MIISAAAEISDSMVLDEFKLLLGQTSGYMQPPGGYGHGLKCKFIAYQWQ